MGALNEILASIKVEKIDREAGIPIYKLHEANIPDVGGIYIAHEWGKALYVGSSQSLRKRLQPHHHKLSWIPDRYPCSKLIFIECPSLTRDELFALEHIYIAKYRPRYNGKSKTAVDEKRTESRSSFQFGAIAKATEQSSPASLKRLEAENNMLETQNTALLDALCKKDSSTSDLSCQILALNYEIGKLRRQIVEHQDELWKVLHAPAPVRPKRSNLDQFRLATDYLILRFQVVEELREELRDRIHFF